MLETAFWMSLLALAYVYVGYPVVVVVLGTLRPRPIRAGDGTPGVTVLIAAYNEARHIRATVENKLAQDYPRDRLQVIVVSDGSTDGTDDAVRAIADPRVRLLRQTPRQGKTAALDRAVALAEGEVLVFSDANSWYAPDAIRRLVRSFGDRNVGYVTGRMVYGNPDGTMIGDGCSAYMRYENWLRRGETRIGSVVGVDGGIDAVRRELYRPMRPDQLPDMVLPLRVVEAGYRVVYEPDAVLHERALGTPSDEYRMRVRVSLRAFWAIRDMAALLDPLRHGLFSLQLWSHKVLRYVAFAFLGVAFVMNAVLAGRHPGYAALLAGQVAFYGLALVAHRGLPGSDRLLLRVPYYFSLVNLAAAAAFWKFLRGARQTLWTPRLG